MIPENVELSSPSLYINRELSLLEFQRRVLEEALDDRNPLLERIKFLAIFGSNMDEFFMVRVSGIRKQVQAHILEVFPDGLTPPEVLAAARKLSLELYESALRCLNKRSFPNSTRRASILWIITSSQNLRRRKRMITSGRWSTPS